MQRIILHCDLDAFFCRAEEIKNPFLEGKAFIVGGDGRSGIVSTCSYKAREYGIHSGMPTFQAKMLCKDILILPGDYEFYELLSKEFIHALKEYSNLIEQMSIDECFLDLTDYFVKSKKDINVILKNIQDKIFNQTKLKCSIGVGTTKFIAKMASDYKKPLGITIIRNKDIVKMLFPLPVNKFFGIGKKSSARLNEIGIKTIGNLYEKSLNEDQALKEVIGKFIYEIPLLLEGKSDNKVETSERDPKSIGMSRTFMFDSNDRNYILDFLNKEIDLVIDSLIKEGKLAKTINISYKDASCETNFKLKSVSKSFSNYTQNKEKIKSEAINLFNETYDGEIIRLIGFSLKNLKSKSKVTTQMTLFDYKEHEKESECFLLINDLNREFKKDVFKKLSDLEK